MPNKNVTLTDENGNNVYPKTFVNNVYDENNVSLDHLISGLPLGMIIPSSVVQTDAGLHLLDGSQLSTTGMYAQFCTWLTAKYNADNTSVKTCTEAEWQAEVFATGQCGKFVITSSTIRLPKITQFIEGLSSLSDLGKRVDAGLPNIKGTTSHSAYGEGYEAYNDGALYADNYGSAKTISTSWVAGVAIHFDASRSNSIYNDNVNTVQPQSIRYPYYIVVATVVKTQITVDLDQYISDLNLKADKDLSNSSVPHITESYINGSSGFNIWSNGYCEQWGVTSLIADYGTSTVTLLRDFINTNYNITTGVAMPSSGDDGNWNNANCTRWATKTKSSFQIYSRGGTDGGRYIYWKVCGYIR